MKINNTGLKKTVNELINRQDHGTGGLLTHTDNLYNIFTRIVNKYLNRRIVLSDVVPLL